MDAFRPMKYYINSDRVTSIKIIECAMERIRRASEKEKSNEKLYSNGNEWAIITANSECQTRNSNRSLWLQSWHRTHFSQYQRGSFLMANQLFERTVKISIFIFVADLFLSLSLFFLLFISLLLLLFDFSYPTI